MEEKQATSRVRRSEGSYSFRIEGYSGLSTRVGDSTESPEFDLCGYTWQLRIFPGGSLESHRGYISFYLASKSTKSARASYRLCIVNQLPGGTDEVFASSGVRLFEAKGVQIDGWGRDKFMTVAMLANAEFGYCMMDAVIFRVEISVFGDLEPCPSVSGVSFNSQPEPGLAKCMKSLLMDDDTADISIVFGNTTNLRLSAHRCVLKCRSPVFAAMLKSQMSEVSSGIILISDVDHHVMRELMHFMYTDTLSDVTVLDAMAESLLSVGCKYQVLGLVMLCENHLAKQLSAENAIIILQLADMYSALKLKDQALQVIAQNALSIMQTKEFNQLDGDLLKEVKSVIDAALRRKGCRGAVEAGERRFATSCMVM